MNSRGLYCVLNNMVVSQSRQMIIAVNVLAVILFGDRVTVRCRLKKRRRHRISRLNTEIGIMLIKCLGGDFSASNFNTRIAPAI